MRGIDGIRPRQPRFGNETEADHHCRRRRACLFQRPLKSCPSQNPLESEFFRSLLAPESGVWETVHMANKRTKADKAQRQANQLEKRADTHAEQTPKKPQTREDFSQAAARIGREATEQK